MAALFQVNIAPFAIVESRELSHQPKSGFWVSFGIEKGMRMF